MITFQQIEAIEQQAWENMFDIAPADYKKEYAMFYKRIAGATCLVFPRYPVVHFNMVVGLGLKEPVTDNVLDEIENLYKNVKQPVYMIQYFDEVKPTSGASLFTSKGYRVAGEWERIVWKAQQLKPIETNRNISVKKLSAENVNAWAKFIINLYHYPVEGWLPHFWNKKGWEHFVAYENNKIAAVRSVFIGKNNIAWSGVEAPVPIVMTTDVEPDRVIWKHLQQHCLENDVEYLVADIEYPSLERNTSIYKSFEELGFEVLYLRKLYRK